MLTKNTPPWYGLSGGPCADPAHRDWGAQSFRAVHIAQICGPVGSSAEAPTPPQVAQISLLALLGAQGVARSDPRTMIVACQWKRSSPMGPAEQFAGLQGQGGARGQGEALGSWARPPMGHGASGRAAGHPLAAQLDRRSGQPWPLPPKRMSQWSCTPATHGSLFRSCAQGAERQLRMVSLRPAVKAHPGAAPEGSRRAPRALQDPGRRGTDGKGGVGLSVPPSGPRPQAGAGAACRAAASSPFWMRLDAMAPGGPAAGAEEQGSPLRRC